MNKKISNMKRLSLDLEQEVHTLIKTSATLKNITMRKWILRAIMKQIEKEKTFD